eukprot:2558681-Prymnesium_polylepis.1
MGCGLRVCVLRAPGLWVCGLRIAASSCGFAVTGCKLRASGCSPAGSRVRGFGASRASGLPVWASSVRGRVTPRSPRAPLAGARPMCRS